MLTPIELIKATVDGMAERGFGRIVNITSSAVKSPIDILGLSNGARSGLTGFVAGVARNPNLAARGVTINNLLPGKFDTDRIKTTVASAYRRSVEIALKQRSAAVDYSLNFGRGLPKSLADKFVGMYVNEDSLAFTEELQRAMTVLREEYWEVPGAFARPDAVAATA